MFIGIAGILYILVESQLLELLNSLKNKKMVSLCNLNQIKECFQLELVTVTLNGKQRAYSILFF